ncbi:DNA-packaging protein [Cohnella nanjingensis]|uniref:DNA-packaging protein n=1 Tax=Cohnella nanjingensis TaxID=1387779 RepID=A0A7X0RMJ8_9BACL|nr:DNA-packaging protein [Cohnella nanjingensis]MBB6670274.1 DNA-packaging protein [Cohnella nanjingensis]
MATSSKDIWPLVKKRLGVRVNDHDELIELYTDEIGQRIRTYINATAVPEALTYTWAAMVASALSAEQLAVLFPPGEETVEFETTIGDTTVKPIKSVTAPSLPTVAVLDSVVFDYRGELNAFRKLRW